MTPHRIDPYEEASAPATSAEVHFRFVLRLQKQLTRKPLDVVATLIHGLTYGEMIELCGAIWEAQPAGLAITSENLPALLHRWPTDQCAGPKIAPPAAPHDTSMPAP
jgi:hypothetical protein